jgi:hypothetical protein
MHEQWCSLLLSIPNMEQRLPPKRRLRAESASRMRQRESLKAVIFFTPCISTSENLCLGQAINSEYCFVRFVKYGRDFSLLHVVQTSSRAHADSYQMGTGGSFPGSRGVKLTTHFHILSRSRIHGSIHPLFCTPSWRSAYLVKHRENLTSFLTFVENISRCAIGTPSPRQLRQLQLVRRNVDRGATWL